MPSYFIRITFFFLSILLPALAAAQTIAGKLATAFKIFAADSQLRNGLVSLYVLDATTGKVVLNKNGKIGLAPASTQKIITSISAYELLGKNFRYQTRFAYATDKNKGVLLILPSGDPTFGSWRWPGTTERAVIQKIRQAITKAGVSAIREVIIDNAGWQQEAVPDGWLWQDIGNYYGAGQTKLNWRENQFDVILKSSKNIGDPVSITRLTPPIYNYVLQSELTAAATGTGDQAYIYFPLNAPAGVIRGTIPVNQPSFKISGAMPAAAQQFARTLLDSLATAGVKTGKSITIKSTADFAATDYTTFCTVTSPPLDSLIFWLNRKSVNLYSEALVKTLAYKSKKNALTATGLDIIREYWQKRDIPGSELSLVDGSGLSPLNRVTTQAQVRILRHAQKQNWFKGFYAALPVHNGIKMKSGTIHGVKGFCGYHTGPDGHQYVFSFLVNNYHGSATALVPKMYKVLNALK